MSNNTSEDNNKYTFPKLGGWEGKTRHKLYSWTGLDRD